MRLKENHLYLVTDDAGQITGADGGLYRRDTRFLSRLEWRVAGESPTVLSTHSAEPYRFSQHLTEAHLGHAQRLELRRKGSLDGVAYREVLRVRPRDDLNQHVLPWGARQPDLHDLELRLDCDFLDMLEVRGLEPQAREVTVTERPDGLEFAYEGKDGLPRRTLVSIDPLGTVSPPEEGWETSAAPNTLGSSEAQAGPRQSGTARVVRWRLHERELAISVTVTPLQEGTPAAAGVPDLPASYRSWRESAQVRLGNPLVGRVFDQATNDLRALLFDTPFGPFPAAGIPWYVAPFGRDSLWVALMLLPWRPEVARGTLAYLGAHQGVRFDESTREAPGKILHEERVGEATRMGRTPHRPYYGTVDATPLWLCLLGDYLEWTGDLETVQNLEKAARACLAWMDGEDADPDRDGFIEYVPHKGGIGNQGWKDSGDSTFHADGSDLSAPIALVEVQGYAYRARQSAARVLRALGDPRGAAEQERRAEDLAAAFHGAFWLPDLGFYAHALDGEKRPARVLTSNPGHALWAGIVPPEAVQSVTDYLFGPDLWSGWGIRTLGLTQVRYNPVSYHNGSVWPHDNAITALGLARYGQRERVRQLAGAQLEAAAIASDARLPELFAGYQREDTAGVAATPPVPYPAACHPQAWAAAAPFAYLHAALALQPGRAGEPSGLPTGWGGVAGSVIHHGAETSLI